MLKHLGLTVFNYVLLRSDDVLFKLLLADYKEGRAKLAKVVSRLLTCFLTRRIGIRIVLVLHYHALSLAVLQVEGAMHNRFLYLVRGWGAVLLIFDRRLEH